MKPYGLVHQYAASRVDAATAGSLCERDPYLCEELTLGMGAHNLPRTCTPLCCSWCISLLAILTVMIGLDKRRLWHALDLARNNQPHPCIRWATSRYASQILAMYMSVTASECIHNIGSQDCPLYQAWQEDIKVKMFCSDQLITCCRNHSSTCRVVPYPYECAGRE